MAELYWRTWGPMYTSHRELSEPLSISYTDGVDTRFHDYMILGPNMPEVSAAVGGTTANVNSIDFAEDASGNVVAYIQRGTDPAKLSLSDNFAVLDPSISLSERGTQVLKTKNGDGTQEVSLFMEGTDYVTVQTVASVANTISNDDFETNTTGWAEAGGTVTLSRSNEYNFNNSYSLKVATTANGTYKGALYTAQAAVAGEIWTATVWVKAPSTSNNYFLGISWLDAGSSFLSDSSTEITAPSTGWFRITVTGTAPSSTAFAQFVIYRKENAAVTFYIDGASLIKQVADTKSTNSAGQTIRVAIPAAEKVYGFAGQRAYGIDLSGSTLMRTGAWSSVDAYGGTDITPTGAALDGPYVVWGTDNGPLLIYGQPERFDAVFDRLVPDPDVCRAMKKVPGMGTIVPLENGIMLLNEGVVTLHAGPDTFRDNDTPVQGTLTALDFDGNWAIGCFHNRETGTRYIVAFRPRQSEDPHYERYSYYCIGSQSSACEAIAYAGLLGSRTTPTWIVGDDSDVKVFMAGRSPRWPDDGLYRYSTVPQNAYFTEVRAPVGKEIIPEEFWFQLENGSETSTVELSISVDDGSYVKLGTANKSGTARFRVNDKLKGWKLQPRATLSNGGIDTTTPRVRGYLAMKYELVDRESRNTR